MSALEKAYRAAVALQRRGAYPEAVDAWRDLLARAPDVPGGQENLTLALLGAGDYAEGFPRYDIRFTRDVGRVAKPALSFPEWRGEPLAGKSILVWMEQGFGDQIMFARFVAELAGQGAEVSILAPPALVRLFAALPARVIAASGQVTMPRHDFWAMPGSLPGRLGTTLATLPPPVRLAVAPRAGSGVGVCAQGRPTHANDARRSLRGDARDALLALGRDLAPEATGARDFQDTAEIVADLALVITVDTALAHLAASMGKPTWILLPAQDVDWRWMGGRTDSPWYPSVRLFRQGADEDWGAVIARVAAAAAQRIGGA